MFKKLLSYALIFLLIMPISSWATDTPSVYKLVGSGTVTQANMRISAAAGVSFVDFTDSEAAGNKLINHLGYLLKIKSLSNGAVIQGFVRNAGTVETLDSEVLASWGNTGYETLTLSGINITQAINDVGANGTATSPITLTAGELYKTVLTLTLTSGTAPFATFIDGDGLSALFNELVLSGGANTYYRTCIASGVSAALRLRNLGTAADYACVNTIKQVLTPSATGVTISSTKGGTSLDNWAQKDAAFNYNDASGYSYELWKVNNAPVIASGSLAAGAVKASMVSGGATQSGGAFCDPVGLDLSPYADGKHILWLQDSGGYVAFGKMKEAGSAEGLDSEILVSWGNSGYETLTITGVNITQAINDVGGNGTATAAMTFVASRLYKESVTLTLTSGTAPFSTFLDGNGSILFNEVLLSAGANTNYKTSLASGASAALRLRNLGTAADYACVNTIKQVLTPSATGAVITDAAGLYNWSYKHASFDANLACTWKVLYVGSD